MKYDIKLKVCKRTDLKYQEIRNRHYVLNNGTHGQQIHFLILLDGDVIGIISGASSVYGVAGRDTFFNIPKNKEIKESYYLPAIINNTVFRLETHLPNLATQILSKWRKVVAVLWENLYGVPVIGFETFVVEEDYRKGCLYKADNWTYVGETCGSTKKHSGMTNKHERLITDKKLIYCKWVSKEVIPNVKYLSSWRNETDEEKTRKKRIENIKKEMLGSIY